MSTRRIAVFTCAVLLVSSAALDAGDAWVPDPGDGTLQLGFSRKTASTSWDGAGNVFPDLDHAGKISYHDFRYTYLSGEVGLAKNLSGMFLFTYLYGLEGEHGNEVKNAGFSDTWLGLKYQVHHGNFPVAVEFTYRTPFLYDLPGPYSYYLYNQNGTIRSPSPEWRGLLKHDYTLSAAVSHSLNGGRGWWDAEAGYTWRQGAPADQIPLYAEAGYRLPFFDASGKVFGQVVRSRYNNSLPQPDDRFNMVGHHYNFNTASMARLGASVLVPFGAHSRWSAEIGYDQWVWGRSARRYREPFVSISRSF